jgi:methylated-DNA-[protein]-cysteine S-methyltransferase
MFYGIIYNQIQDLVVVFNKDFLLQTLFIESENFDFSFVEKNFHREENFGLFLLAKSQIGEYFKGQRKEFSLPLHFNKSTTFITGVYQGLNNIDYGTTLSYQDFANKIGFYRAYRAVGTALSKNDFCVVIPCHRIVRKSSELGGV